MNKHNLFCLAYTLTFIAILATADSQTKNHNERHTYLDLGKCYEQDGPTTPQNKTKHNPQATYYTYIGARTPTNAKY